MSTPSDSQIEIQQGRSQLSLRQLFVFVTLFALAILATSYVPLRIAPMFGAPLFILAFLITIEPRAIEGAVVGFVLGAWAMMNPRESIGLALLVGNWGAMLGATTFTIIKALIRVSDRTLKDGHEQKQARRDDLPLT